MQAEPRRSTAFTNVDFERQGRQIGSIHIPHSPHSDAWGAVVIPVAVIANGRGPTVILQGGNHGDEYEGPITICELIRDLDPAAISGRIIALPAINAPAVAAGHRTSPDDGLNMNRTFPGDPLGSITQQISAYVTDHVYPLADAFLDLHSGGSSLNIVPSAIVEPAEDRDLHRRIVAAVQAFDAPLTVVINNLGDPRTSTATAVRAGLITVGTEMGGGGTVSMEALRICRRGVRNVLAHLGVLPTSAQERTEGERRLLEIPGSRGYVYASAAGVFEPLRANGEEVRAGMPVGRVHNLLDPSQAPKELTAAIDGIVYGTRHPGRVVTGNCCMAIATPYRGTLE